MRIGLRVLAALLVIPHLTLAQGLSTRLSHVHLPDFPRVSVVLAVFSEDGKPVAGLTKDEFTLDEGGTPVAVVNVELEKAPLQIALVLDTSGSMQPHMAALKQASGDFVRNLDVADRVLLVTFSDRPSMLVDLTADRRRVMDAVEALQPGGATALFDGIHAALQGMRVVKGRRIALVFTDGRDQNAAGTAPQSAYGAKPIAHLARDLQIPLWTIGLGTEVDVRLLERLAAATGGQSYQAKQAGQLRRAFVRVLGDVRLQYRVTYVSPNAKTDGSERVVTVSSRSKGRTGQGRIRYLAPAPAPPPPPPAQTGSVVSGGSRGGEPGAERVLAVQVGKLVFRGWNPRSSARVFRGTGATGEKPFASTSWFLATNELALPAGKYEVHIIDIGGNVSGRFSIEIKGGETLIVPGPNYAPEVSPAPAPPEEPEPSVETRPVGPE
jgi:VWFA-related protein